MYAFARDNNAHIACSGSRAVGAYRLPVLNAWTATLALLALFLHLYRALFRAAS